MRQFVTTDYLDCPNPYFYKPLQINGTLGVYGLNHALVNGYHRLNLRSQTNYYSPLKVYGFKFNFLATLQLSQLSYQKPNLFDNRPVSGFGLGCLIRNENLTFNTFQIDCNYFPYVPYGVRRNFYFEMTTTTDFSFNIFPLRKPADLNFQ